MQRLREEDDTVLRGSEDEARALEEGTGADEVEDSEEAPLRQNAIILPQELIDMILEKLFDDDPHARPRIRIDSNFQTPLALRLCHWTREKYVAKYYTRSTFILSAPKTHTSFFKYFQRLPYERTLCYIYEWREDEDGCEVSISREKRSHPRHRRYLCKWFRREPSGFYRENEQWIGRLRTVKQFYRRRAEDYEVWRRSLEPTILGMEPEIYAAFLIALCFAVVLTTMREGWKGVFSFESTASFGVRVQNESNNL